VCGGYDAASGFSRVFMCFFAFAKSIVFRGRSSRKPFVRGNGLLQTLGGKQNTNVPVTPARGKHGVASRKWLSPWFGSKLRPRNVREGGGEEGRCEESGVEAGEKREGIATQSRPEKHLGRESVSYKRSARIKMSLVACFPPGENGMV
jgi:hypothetical protein